MVQKLEEKPPYVRFEVQAVEDRAATLEAGYWVGRDVIFAHITPRGSKDIHEAIAIEWLMQLRSEVRQDRFRQDWLDHYERAYKNFLEGVEAPLDGFSLKNWPAIRPAQLKVCQSLNMHTLEDLVGANEQALQAIGMGARGLQTAAKAYLDQASNPGKVAAKQLALEQENANLATQLTTLTRRLDEMKSKLDAEEA